MDTCDIVDFLGRGLLLLAAIGALIDCAWRDIPRVITMYRVLLTMYTCIGILREIMRLSSYVVAQGLLYIVSIGFLWPLCLYFLEHFIHVFLTIDLKDRTMSMSNLFKFWKIARIAIFVMSTILAIIFGFIPVNGVMFGNRLITLMCFAIVVLPVCVTILRLIFAFRAHLGESFEAGSKRAKKLKSTYRQLVGFFIIVSFSSLGALVFVIRGLIDTAAYLDMPWMPTGCIIGATFYELFLPQGLALYLTRLPSARRRRFASTVAQRMSKSSRENVMRSQLKKPEITSVCVESVETGEPKIACVT